MNHKQLNVCVIYCCVPGFLVNGVNNINTSTLERRFQLSSSQVGWVSSAYDISAALFILPITFYGTFGHKPRILAVAAFCMSLGSFTMCMAHFTSGKYEYGSRVADSCDLLGNYNVPFLYLRQCL